MLHASRQWATAHSQNLIVKTGPLSKKNSRTKLYTKFWAVLRNDVLSWYESAAVSDQSRPKAR